MDAPGKETQFYAMLGQRSIYHDGWLAATLHPPLSGWGKFDQDEWELYHLETDRSQSTNVAADHPDRVQALKDLWFYYAGIYNGLPLDDRTALEQVLAERPKGGPDRQRYEYFPDCADVPESAGVAINGRSYTIAAGVELETADAEGVLYAHGGVAGGHSLYVKDRKLKYAFNWVGTKVQTIEAEREITTGEHICAVEFVVDGPSTDPNMPGFGGTATLYVDDEAVGSGPIVTQPGILLPRRRRDLRRARQRLAGHAGLRRPWRVRVHRWHHRQGGGRRDRRALRRPRGAGAGLAPEGLTFPERTRQVSSRSRRERDGPVSRGRARSPRSWSRARVGTGASRRSTS